ncbi:DUF3888 domain-containing protein [Vulcanibacillus modesticaldus]|uniref:DUF3888 domain-containing protein n=1 Tax=Vulcanibacillus modesticaldus TaxID=337097 RepID=UPI00114CC1AE|nr:DUF3888 domain-containing protein [Vulcanibacillus modesticaldus]
MIKIIKIERLIEGGYKFKMKILVHSWKSAVPPYGLDTITLEMGPSGTFVTEFIHRDVEKLTE